MAAFNKINAFVEALAEKVHNLQSDTLRIALTNAVPATPAVLADLTEVSYANLSSRTLTVASSAQAGGVYKLTINDLVLTASGGAVGPFRYVWIWNDTAASDNLIGYYDYGSSISLNDGETLTLDFDGTNGVLTLT